MGFYREIEDLFLSKDKFKDKDGKLIKSLIIDSAYRVDSDLIELLITSEQAKLKFFKEIVGYWVFNINDFILFIQDKNFLDDSYTRFKNKIGLNINDKFLKQRDEVALVWPYKDCVLEGGQEKEETKRQEIFFNEVLAQDEIDRLLDPKVLVNWTRHTVNGAEKVTDLKRDENGTIKENLLIKGNNLLALHTLKKQFRNKVKLIYIDPPYNTGNDGFKYNDRFNHSTWLTFMKNRLEVAKELLRDDGVIFVQCDDNEQAYLKVLMDEIYRRENFVSNIVWRKTDNQANIGKIARVKEYILVYSRMFTTYYFNKIELSEKAKKEYRYKDEIGYFRRAILLDKTRGIYTYKIKTPSGKVLNGPWMVKESKFWDLEKENGIYWTSGGDEQPYGKIYLENSKGQIPNDFWGIEVGSNQQGALHMDQLFGSRKFAFPKPESLIQRILEMGTNLGDIILDFHAGSGTTGAVAHKMGRQWILVEQMNYIKDLPEARLIKVLEGEQGGISKAVNWQGGGDFIYCELAKYNETFMDLVQSATTTEELLKIWLEMKAKAFLDYRIETANFETEEFKNLSIEQQKTLLVEVLDKNQLYVNYTEMEDVTYSISKEDKDLSNKFYNK